MQLVWDIIWFKVILSLTNTPISDRAAIGSKWMLLFIPVSSYIKIVLSEESTQKWLLDLCLNCYHKLMIDFFLLYYNSFWLANIWLNFCRQRHKCWAINLFPKTNNSVIWRDGQRVCAKKRKKIVHSIHFWHYLESIWSVYAH